MRDTSTTTTRRGLIKWGFATAAAVETGGLVRVAAESSTVPKGSGTLRDRFWIWTHQEGSYTNQYGLPRTSRMTPVEGAAYLGVPNLLFVRYSAEQQIPLDQFAISFRPMKRVVWSLVGAGGQSQEAERRRVLEVASREANVSGFIMDDFFRPDGSGALDIQQLTSLRRDLVIAGRRRDLIVVLYQHQLDMPVKEHLSHCDKITFWTWEAKDLGNLESAFERLEKLAPKPGKLLGCYMWDFGAGKPITLDAMKRQCETGRRWLAEGRIEGMVFLASNICDLGLETVEWTRRWIAEVGDKTE